MSNFIWTKRPGEKFWLGDDPTYSAQIDRTVGSDYAVNVFLDGQQIGGRMVRFLGDAKALAEGIAIGHARANGRPR